MVQLSAFTNLHNFPGKLQPLKTPNLLPLMVNFALTLVSCYQRLAGSLVSDLPSASSLKHIRCTSVGIIPYPREYEEQNHLANSLQHKGNTAKHRQAAAKKAYLD